MKRPVEWHIENLQNAATQFRTLEQNIKTLIQRAEARRNELLFYQHQINSAKREHRKSFDADKYRVPKKKKVVEKKEENLDS